MLSRLAKKGPNVFHRKKNRQVRALIKKIYILVNIGQNVLKKKNVKMDYNWVKSVQIFQHMSKWVEMRKTFSRKMF